MITHSGKSALATCASRGIGRASALALGQGGAEVLVQYGQGAKEAETVVGEHHPCRRRLGALDRRAIRGADPTHRPREDPVDASQSS